MVREVVWTETACADLERIADHIAGDSPAYAAAFVRRIQSAASSLSELPLRGRVVPEFRDPSVRERIVGSYRVLYLVRQKSVSVLAVVHGARKLPALPDAGGVGEGDPQGADPDRAAD
jgi:plasmid stabilization system protein ParE